MEALITFVVKYWLEVLFATFGAIMTAWVKKLQGKLKQKQIEQDAIVEGMKAILHDLLYQMCEKYLELGYIPVRESEKIMKREKKIYKAYNGLHGNDTGTDIHEKFVDLPIRSPEKEDEDER